MEQVEIVDRDYSEVEEAENDSRKRKTPKIKLTATSANAFDWLYAGVRRKEGKLEKVKEKIQNAERKQSEIDEQQGIKGFLSFVVIDIKKNLLQKKKFKLENAIGINNRRAVRIEDRMKKNILYKYFESLNNLNVNDIDKDSIASAVDDAFDNMSKDYGDNQKVKEPEKDIEVAENDAVVNDDKLNQTMGNESVSGIEKPRDRHIYESDDRYNEYLKEFYSPELEVKTNYNENGLVEGVYRLKENEIIKDDLVFKNDFDVETSNTESDLSQAFDSEFMPKSEKVEEVDSMDISGNNDDIAVDEDIFSRINNSLNDENITSSDLAKLREELEAERNKKNKLTEELEEKMKRAAVIEKEAAAALQEQKEKIKLVFDELAAYKEENKRLETQTQQVEESTQRQISIRQQSLNYISSLNEMIGPHAVNVTVTKESSKGI